MKEGIIIVHDLSQNRCLLEKKEQDRKVMKIRKQKSRQMYNRCLEIPLILKKERDFLEIPLRN